MYLAVCLRQSTAAQPRANLPHPYLPLPLPCTSQLAADYANLSPLIVPILKGSFIFAADLVSWVCLCMYQT